MSVTEHPTPAVDGQALSIGAFARRSRLSMKALRLYARLGLLSPVHIDEANGYRWYRTSQLATARLIAMLRRLEMPLSQVAEVISAAGPDVAEVGRLLQTDTSAPPVANGGTADARGLVASATAAELVAAYWESVERRIASQRQLAAHLQIRLSGKEGSFLDMYDVRQREVPDQTVLTEQRHVHVAELPGWITQAIDRLMGSAQKFGGVAGPIFVVYHGEVNQDSDGPVEVCVPIASTNGAPTDVATRRERAHKEAYVRITKAQVEYPQILSAFDAVMQWVPAHGLTISAPPREVYFTDFMSAKPTDEVCDVAIPIE